MPNPFDADTIPSEEQPVTLEDLVGEGRKYRDPNELAKAYNHADALIQQQKAKELEDAAKIKVLQDLLDARNSNPSNPDPKPQTPTPETPREEPKPTDTNVDISELVRKELSSANEETRKANNINQAAEAMSRHYGSEAKAQEAIRARANQLGVKFEWLRDVAADSPQAFYASMGVTPNARPGPTPGYTNEVNRSGGGGLRNYEHYEAIRKSDPKLYHSAEMRKQMMDSARELGDKFFAR